MLDEGKVDADEFGEGPVRGDMACGDVEPSEHFVELAVFCGGVLERVQLLEKERERGGLEIKARSPRVRGKLDTRRLAWSRSGMRT